MHPVLLSFHLGDSEVTLGAYSTFYVLAWGVALVLGTVVARRRELAWWRALLFYLVTLIVGIVGARLLDVSTDWGTYATDPGLIYGLDFRGFSLYGGLLLAAGAGALLARPLRVPLWRTADSAVPAMVAAIVLMRTGCYLRGCCFGNVTSLPWGVTFPSGSPAWSHQLETGQTGILGLAGIVHPVHPTQIYEMIAAAVCGALAIWLMLRGRGRGGAPQAAARPASDDGPGANGQAAAPIRRATAEGVPFLVLVLGFTLFRVAEYYLRPLPASASEPVWLYPLLYALIIVGVAALIAVRTGRACRAEPGSLQDATRRPVAGR